MNGSTSEPVVNPVRPDCWAALTEVFGERGDPAHCWCQWYRLDRPGYRATTVERRRAALYDQVSGAGPPPGVMAWLDGAPVGWCAAAPRPGYARLRAGTVLRSAQVVADLDDPRIWAVTCFVVRRAARRQRVATALLDGAVALAGKHGATAVEAYPVDLAARRQTSSAELFHGALSTFLAAGFRELGRSSPARPVVRREL
jgi:GNAT superfamily N-acetyltransferase